MFDTPAYASYIALCRELRLERKWEHGDWYWSDTNGWPDTIERWTPEPDFHVTDPVWLPRLDQWLTMLEEAGWADVEFCARAIDMECYLYGAHPDDMERFTGWFPTREEAAARLWVAVTGRK